jgi:hypothetical protein
MTTELQKYPSLNHPDIVVQGMDQARRGSL